MNDAFLVTHLPDYTDFYSLILHFSHIRATVNISVAYGVRDSVKDVKGVRDSCEKSLETIHIPAKSRTLELSLHRK